MCVADDASGRGDRASLHDVPVGLGRQLRPGEDLKLEEAHDDRAKRDERRERHPFVTLAELADVGPRDQEIAHAREPPASAREPEAVAA